MGDFKSFLKSLDELAPQSCSVPEIADLSYRSLEKCWTTIEDESGQAGGGIVPYHDATADEKWFGEGIQVSSQARE